MKRVKFELQFQYYNASPFDKLVLQEARIDITTRLKQQGHNTLKQHGLKFKVKKTRIQCFLLHILSRGDSWNTWDEKTPSCTKKLER